MGTTYHDEGFLELDDVSRVRKLEEQVTLTVNVSLLVDGEDGRHVDDFEGDLLVGLQVLGEHHLSVRSLAQQLDLFVFVQLRFGFLLFYLFFFFLLFRTARLLLLLLLVRPREHRLTRNGRLVERLLAHLRHEGVAEVVGGVR